MGEVAILNIEDNFSAKSCSIQDTIDFATGLARYVFPGLVITLSGDLGTGKTVIAKALAHALGADNTRSPSFTIVNEYSGSLPIAHIDLYRINKCSEQEFDIEYYISNGFLVIIEWPERLTEKPGSDIWNIRIDFDTDENGNLLLSRPYNRSFILASEGKEASIRLSKFINEFLKGDI